MKESYFCQLLNIAGLFRIGIIERDVNAVINIKNRAVRYFVLKARGVRWSNGTVKREAHTIASA